VLENRVLNKIFGLKRVEITGKWRRLHTKELYTLYCSPNIIRVTKSRRMRWTVHMARMGDMRGAYRILAETPFTQPRRRWNHNIKTDEEIGCGRRVD
jgi:hypothetical protein